jgi:hypothetical protein
LAATMIAKLSGVSRRTATPKKCGFFIHSYCCAYSLTRSKVGI